MADDVVIVFRRDGTFDSVYTDDFPFSELGPLQMTRAGRIEWDADAQRWRAIMNDGSRSVGFHKRGDAVAWEHEMAVLDLVWPRRLIPIMSTFFPHLSP